MRILARFFGSVAVLACTMQAFDYKVDGNVVSSTRIGLSDNKRMDTQKGIYPNNSFWALSTQLGISANLLKSESQTLKVGLSGMVGGVALDTTRDGNTLYPTNSTTDSTTSVGDFTSVYMPAWGDITNAYVYYKYGDYFGIRAGRYDFNNEHSVALTDYWSGRNQGVEAFVGVKNFNIYAIYINARSSSNYEWLNHFEARNPNYNRYGLFVVGANAKWNINDNHQLSFYPYVYFQPGVYTDPGIKLIYDGSFSKFKSKSTILVLHAIHDTRMRTTLSDQDWGEVAVYNNGIYQGRELGKGGTTLFLKQEFFIETHSLGAAVYKNFGNANGLISSYGDPTGLNTWVYTLYSTGPTWSDFFSQDALNTFAFYGQKFNKWNYQLIARYTYAPRADENSLAFLLGYDFTEHINLNLRLEWAGTTNKAGYKLNETFLTHKVYNDKSMIFWYLTAKI